jgi:hypothetical protein
MINRKESKMLYASIVKTDNEGKYKDIYLIKSKEKKGMDKFICNLIKEDSNSDYRFIIKNKNKIKEIECIKKAK